MALDTAVKSLGFILKMNWSIDEVVYIYNIPWRVLTNQIRPGKIFK